MLSHKTAYNLNIEGYEAVHLQQVTIDKERMIEWGYIGIL